ncbi:MAG TPA: HAMP domain-containing sensor histidine kinase [Puia sp.]|uniref:sensor histidine kinase n=1 Tax=Puia sp. TaxID=2045100 RepID=UPI002C72392F|nr:HAMP domain-containing sensor histidine kinase [Puia sp.]HVU99351.1 HAMP domain-containing sensor histidine kinase [Puia sp.]
MTEGNGQRKVLDRLVTVVSHELKTPLTSIMAFTHLAREAGSAEDMLKTRYYLEKIDRQAIKLYSLIQQLLDISWMESGKMTYRMQEWAWNVYLREAAPQLQYLVPGHHLQWQPCHSEAWVYMDTLRIEQVLTNLVANAAKYSNPDTYINIDCSFDSDNLTVCVRDQGIGIRPENRTRIFEKYFQDETVAGKYGGFGMGLYISSGIIRAHKGTIRADRNEPAGSCFYFTLPLSRSGAC